MIASIWPSVIFMFVILPGFAILVIWGAVWAAGKTEAAVRKVAGELGLQEVDTPEGEAQAVAFEGMVDGVQVHVSCGWQEGQAMVAIGGGHGFAQQKIPVSGTQIVARLPGELGFELLMRPYVSLWPRAFKLNDKEFDRICLIETCGDEQAMRAMLESDALRAELVRFFKPRWIRNRLLTEKTVYVMNTSRKPAELLSTAHDAIALAALIGRVRADPRASP